MGWAQAHIHIGWHTLKYKGDLGIKCSVGGGGYERIMGWGGGVIKIHFVCRKLRKIKRCLKTEGTD